jgi:hypothetical protein
VEKAHEVTEVRFDGDRLILMVDGHMRSVAVADCSHKLLEASAEQRARFVVSTTGYGIHWPDLDEDLSIDRLICAQKPRAKTRVQKRGKSIAAHARDDSSR